MGRLLDSAVHNVRHALRSLRRSPGFTLTVILVLALGIGANTAVFSVVNGVLFRPLPYEQPDRLVAVWNQLDEAPRTGISGPDFMDYKDQADLFESMSNIWATSTNLYGDGEAEGIVLSWVAPEFFDVWGVEPALGRDFLPDDKIRVDLTIFGGATDVEPPPLALVISHGLWLRRYGGAEDVIGRTLNLNGQTGVVIGVAPRDFQLNVAPDIGIPTEVDVWTLMPVDLRADMPRGPSGLIRVVGRLKPGVTIEQAQAQMDAIAVRQRELYATHEAAGLGIEVVPLKLEAVGHVRPILLVLLGAVGFVLLIACANVANLLLVRASAREKEIAIRSALGGSRASIAGNLLVESLLLAILGGAAGLFFADLGIDLLIALQPEGMPRVDRISIDGSVMLFTLIVSIAAAGLFGAAPSLLASRADLGTLLKERTATGGASRSRFRSALIVGEVAISVVLLIGAGLMLRSFAALGSTETGFEDQGVLTFRFALPVFAYREAEQRSAFFREVAREVGELPTVETVGAVGPLPLSRTGNGSAPFALDAGDEDAWVNNQAAYHSVIPGFFEAMRVDLVSGRTFRGLDNEPGAEPVVIIDRKMAESQFGEAEPVGRTIYIASASLVPAQAEAKPARIVGVVENVTFDDLGAESRQTIYRPHVMTGGYLLDFTVRTAGDPMAIAAGVRNVARKVDPALPVLRVRPMSEYVAEAMAPTRFILVMLVIFAGVAVVLAAIGLYGVLSYVVRQRYREIGIRIALGAADADILRLMLSDGLRLAVTGVGLGIGAAFLMSRSIAGLLYGVTATDPLTYAAIAVLLLLVATAATLVPALRAAAVPPSVALRAD